MKNLLLTILLACVGMSGAVAQNFYDVNTIQEIKINFFPYQFNWQHLLDSLKNAPGSPYLVVQSVEVNGEVFDSVGVKYKGYSSYDPGNVKNPLHIELNHVKKGQTYFGIEDIKLSNVYADPTFVREVLSYEILRKYMHEPLANYAKVWLDGDYWGLYVNVESINKGFARKHFHTDGDNPFFKCNPIDVLSTNGHSDLKYEEDHPDSVFYYSRYELRSDYGWADLLKLMDTLTNYPHRADRVLDIDRALWMLAFNNVFVNLDSYTGAYAQNYYIYQDRNDRWLPIVWDLNMSFGSFNNLDGDNLLTVQQLKQLDPLAQSTNDFRPLIKSLLENPTYRRMYLAHMRTMLQVDFSTIAAYRPRILQLQALINAAVLADNNKFYSNAEFLSNIDQTVNVGNLFEQVPGITELMSGRYTYLMSHPALTPTPPTISNVSDLLDGEIYVSAKVLNATTGMLAFRYDSADVFQTIQMVDDGQHHDGVAGDGIFGQSFAYNGIVGQYYIYAENANAGMFSPQRAEHIFYTASLNPPPPPVGDLVINEFLTENINGQTDEVGQHEDWLELFNNSTVPLTLTGIYLTDDRTKPDKWLFPLGTTIPGKGFLIVWLDEDQTQGPLHANFKLDNDGEFLMISNGAGGVIDSLAFGPQFSDTTWGRYPNGTGNFAYLLPTFNALNSLPPVSANEPWQDVSLQIFPNPVSDILTIKSDQPLGLIRVSDALGRQVLQTDASGSDTAYLNLKKLPEGIYCTRIGERAARLICVQRR